MGKRPSVLLWLLIFGVLFAVPGAFGQANLYLNDAGNNVMDGVYVGPYNATINNSPSKIICDDFDHDSNVGESWLANVTSVSTLTNNPSGLNWSGHSSGDAGLLGGTYSTLQGYEAMLYLATQMLGTKDSNQVGYLAYAIWSIFDPKGVYNWLSSHGDSSAWAAVQKLAAGALKGSYSIAQFAGWQIYTPTVCFSNCGGPGGRPQEFFQYTSVPEGGTALSYLLVGLSSCIAAAFYRRKQQVQA